MCRKRIGLRPGASGDSGVFRLWRAEADILLAGLDRRMRFTELHQRIPGVSQRMLSLTLRHLERDGLVARTAYPEVPPRVEYELTDTGRTLIDPAVRLAEWAVEHNPDIDRSQQRYDKRKPPSRSARTASPPGN